MTLHLIGPGGVTTPIRRETVLVCGICVKAGKGYHQPTYDPEPRADGSTVHSCPNCGRVVMVHLDFGELDLGLHREALDPLHDYRLYGEVFGR